MFVECEFLVSVLSRHGKVPVTHDIGTIIEILPMIGYCQTYITCQRTGGNETKAYPTIHTSLLTALTGDTLNRNALIRRFRWL